MARMKVRYRGLSDVRRLEAKQVEKDHGIYLTDDLEWNPQNHHTLILEVDEAFERLLRDQGTFTLSAVDESDKDVEVVATAAKEEEDGGVVMDSTTGQRSKKK